MAPHLFCLEVIENWQISYRCIVKSVLSLSLLILTTVLPCYNVAQYAAVCEIVQPSAVCNRQNSPSQPHIKSVGTWPRMLRLSANVHILAKFKSHVMSWSYFWYNH